MPAFTLEPVAQAICAACKYTYGGCIGQGTFKETFLVTTPDGTRLAVKVLKPGSPTERSAREIEAMKRCSHPNIVGLLELAEIIHAGTKYVYLVEAFMDAGTLEERLKRGLLTRDELLALGDELLRAVEHMAGHDLVHRDFKPANIMYPAAGAEAMVGDFGLVRDLTQTSITKSYLAMGPGSPFFAAPEQLNNEKALIDWRTDEFAIGVTLSVASLGLHPYQERGDVNAGQAIGRVAARKGPSSEFLDAVTAARLPVIAAMVAPWPVERVRTPALLLDRWREQKDKA